MMNRILPTIIINIIFVKLLLLNDVSAGGICQIVNVTIAINLCNVSATPNCLQKCTNLNLSPNYSCKIPQSNCTLQCPCDYFDQNFKERNNTQPLKAYPVLPKLPTPINECILFASVNPEPHCNETCSNGTFYCQVMLPGGPKTCGCHHWVKGNTLIGKYNDFLSINESLYSSNGLYQLKVIDSWHLNVIRVSDKTVLSALIGVQSDSGDRFTLKNNGTFTQQTAGYDLNGKIVEELLMQYAQFDDSAFLIMENCGYAIFYDKNMKRVKVLGINFKLTYKVCPDVNKPPDTPITMASL